MRITYDPRQNVAYIRLREKRAELETLRISDELNVVDDKLNRQLHDGRVWGYGKVLFPE